MEEILNSWLQEKPKDKFDKELHKYTYYDLMEFAEHYHALQLQQTGVSGRSEQLVCGCGSDDIYVEPKVYNCQDCGKSWK